MRATLAMSVQGLAWSPTELAVQSGRGPVSLLRALGTMERHGLVAFEPGQGRACAAVA
jgi:predicted transcriptional regulator